MILLLLSCVCTLVMGLIKQNETSIDDGTLFSYCQISRFFIFFQYVLKCIWLHAVLQCYNSYEFIFAQNPHSMKELLIGTFFAIKGIFQLLVIGVLVVVMPNATNCRFSGTKFPICGFIYYLINIVVALVGIVGFVVWSLVNVAVSELINIHRRGPPMIVWR